MVIKLCSKAKINLTLGIVGIENNYHNISSIVTSINLSDCIRLSRRTDSKINIDFVKDGKSISERIGANNTVAKTLDIMRQCGLLDKGVDILVEKNIPIAGGLGGSSVDAAGVILAVDRAFGLSAKGVNLYEVAAMTGSDTPFMLYGGTALISGRGEVITPIENNLRLNIVVACKNVDVEKCTSKNVYTKYDEINNTKTIDNNTKIIQLLKQGDNAAIKLFYNDLSEAASFFDEGIAQTQEQLLRLGAVNAVMTGSGNCVVGYFQSARHAAAAKEQLVRLGFFAF